MRIAIDLVIFFRYLVFSGALKIRDRIFAFSSTHGMMIENMDTISYHTIFFVSVTNRFGNMKR
jgi:hypothetical protein